MKTLRIMICSFYIGPMSIHWKQRDMIWYIAIDDPKLLLFVARIRQEKQVACRTYLTIIKSLERCLKTNLTANYCLKEPKTVYWKQTRQSFNNSQNMCTNNALRPTTFRPESQQPDKFSFKSKNANFYSSKNENGWFEGKLYKTFFPW